LDEGRQRGTDSRGGSKFWVATAVVYKAEGLSGKVKGRKCKVVHGDDGDWFSRRRTWQSDKTRTLEALGLEKTTPAGKPARESFKFVVWKKFEGAEPSCERGGFRNNGLFPYFG